MDAGLLFECRLGNMDLERPLGLLQQSVQADGEVLVRATRTAEHTPAQRELVWWSGGVVWNGGVVCLHGVCVCVWCTCV